MSQPISLELGIDIDPSVKKAVIELEKMRKAEKAFATEVLKSGKVTDKAAKEMRRRNSEIKKQELALDKAGQAWREFADDTDEATAAQKRLGQEVEAADARFSETSRGVAAAGDVQSNLGALRGLAGAAGLEGISGGLDIGGELIVLTEELPRLKTSLAGLPVAAQKATEVLGLSGFAGSINKVIPGATAGQASMLALGAAAAGIAVIFAAVALAVKHFNDQAQKQVEQLNNIIEQRRELNEKIVEGLTTADAQSQIDVLNKSREDEAKVLARLETAYASFEQQAGPVLGTIAKVISSQEDALAAQIDTSRELLSGFGSEISTLEGAISSGELAANDATIAHEEQAKALEDTTVKEEALANQRAATLSKLTALEQQANTALENFSRRRAQQAEDTALDRTFELEDEQAELQDHYSKLADIRNTGNDKLAEIEAKLTDLPLARTEAIAEATKKSNDSLDKINQDYFSKQISSLDKFRLGETRINERYQKTLRRTLDDLRDSLSDAEASNDVNAFLAAQRDGTKQLKELAEDQNDDARQRLEDFVSQRDAERNAHMEKLAEINSTLALEKAAISETFLLRRTELAVALELEKQAIQERLQSQRDSFAAAQQREDQQESRAEQRLEIRTRREDEALQRQLEAINQKTQAELNSVAQVTSAMLSLAARVQAVAGGSGSGRTRFRQSAPGQAVRRGGLGRFGSSPSNISQGLPVENAPGGFNRKSQSIIFQDNRQVMIGDIASRAEVEEALRINTFETLQTVSAGIRGAVR